MEKNKKYNIILAVVIICVLVIAGLACKKFIDVGTMAFSSDSELIDEIKKGNEEIDKQTKEYIKRVEESKEELRKSLGE